MADDAAFVAYEDFAAAGAVAAVEIIIEYHQ